MNLGRCSSRHLCDADPTALPPFTPQELAGARTVRLAICLPRALRRICMMTSKVASAMVLPSRFSLHLSIAAVARACQPGPIQLPWPACGRDCAEPCARELLNAYLWDAATLSFDPNRLSASCSLGILRRRWARKPRSEHLAAGAEGHGKWRCCRTPGANWHAGAPIYTQAAKEWFEIVSGLPGVSYLTESRRHVTNSCRPAMRWPTASVCCLGSLR